VYSKWEPLFSRHNCALFFTDWWHLLIRSGSSFSSLTTWRIFSSNSSRVVGLGWRYTLLFIIGQMAKSRTVRSGDRGAQLWPPRPLRSAHAIFYEFKRNNSIFCWFVFLKWKGKNNYFQEFLPLGVAPPPSPPKFHF